MMAEKKQQKNKANNHRSAKNKNIRSPQKKAAQAGKPSRVKPSTSVSKKPKEKDQQSDGLTELFKCIDKQLRKNAAAIAERVIKQIEKGFTIKQMVDWMKTAPKKPNAIGGFEEMLSTMEQEADRDSPIKSSSYI